MKIKLYRSCFYTFLCCISIAIANRCIAQQAYTKAAVNAFLITRMAAKFHVQPRSVNDSFSINVYDQLLTEADPDKTVFLQGDIDKFSAWRMRIDDDILQRQTSFISLFSSVYKQRLLQSDSIIKIISSASFDYDLPGMFTTKEQQSFPADITAMKEKLFKTIRLNTVIELAGKISDMKFENAAQQKKITDSLSKIYWHKECGYIKRISTSLLQGTESFEQQMGNMYCNVIAQCYDPHTEFFPLTEKENFESQVGNTSFRFGFALDEAEDGGVIIDGLKPGSPAYKSGEINTGDKIVSIQWQGKEAADVSDADREEVSAILSESNHDKAIIGLQKADGSVRKVELQKEEMSMEDESRVKSFLLKGEKTIGYILLPAFYTDWGEDEENEAGCANDVAKEILKLEKENIQGLIIDLRYNGGGSVEEAANLAGIFIDAGPVAQETGNDGKVYTLKDMNRGTIYNGPLVLLVNAYSASASELVAGTLQDYNRAVIIGTPTYGKATGQMVLPLDTTINLTKELPDIKTDAYLKLTFFKLCRVSGKTAQAAGVQPDIYVPDLLEKKAEREKDAQYVLRVPDIDANKYYKPYPALNIAGVKEAAAKLINDNKYLQSLVKIDDTGDEDESVPLALADNLKLFEKEKDLYMNLPDKQADSSFSVEENAFEKLRIQSGAEDADSNDEIKEFLNTDPQLQIAFHVLGYIIK